MSDKMREEFERSPRFRGMDFTRSPSHPEYYDSPYANGAWDGWKASREAVAIVLPQRYEVYDIDGIVDREDGPLVFVIDICAAIQAQGLKVKP